jgi:hypothetical protein
MPRLDVPEKVLAFFQAFKIELLNMFPLLVIEGSISSKIPPMETVIHVKYS